MEKIEFTRFIERYLEDKMQPSEKRWFEKELEGNLWLRNELELRRKAEMIASNFDAIQLRKKLMNAEARYRKETNIERAVRKVPSNYAAVFLGLILISALFLLSRGSINIDDFTSEALTAYEVTSNSRAVSDITPAELVPGMELYNKGYYEEASALFNAIPDQSSCTVQARFLSGLSAMQTNDYSGAISSFVQVIDNRDNMFMEEASYYLALCYYKEEDYDQAMLALKGILNSESRFRKDAKKLLRKIK